MSIFQVEDVLLSIAEFTESSDQKSLNCVNRVLGTLSREFKLITMLRIYGTITNAVHAYYSWYETVPKNKLSDMIDKLPNCRYCYNKCGYYKKGCVNCLAMCEICDKISDSNTSFDHIVMCNACEQTLVNMTNLYSFTRFTTGGLHILPWYVWYDGDGDPHVDDQLYQDAELDRDQNILRCKDVLLETSLVDVASWFWL